MTTIREPRSLDAAQQLLEKFARLEGSIGKIDAARNAEIAAINAAADEGLGPLLAEREQLLTKLGAWWGKGGREQALEGQKKGAKSVELGGCLIGSKSARATLQLAGDEQSVVDVLRRLRWAKPFLREKITLDRVQVLKDIDGKHAVTFAELGLARLDGEDEFFVKRAEQGQTRG